MEAAISYNRLRAMKARKNAEATSVVQLRQIYLRLAFQYDAIADVEGARPRLVRSTRLWTVGNLPQLPHGQGPSTRMR